MTATALVIGSGPAGLMAAQALAERGLAVTVAEAKPSPARKFLMAGKSGLNITKDEPAAEFAARIDPAAPMAPMLATFGPAEAQRFATDLDQPVFTGSSGRVFPVAMKASPLLRAWLARLDRLGVQVHRRWRWTGWDGADTLFDTPDRPRRLRPDATVLALGGGSWARLGSDGAWVAPLRAAGVQVAPFKPANMGFGADWFAPMTKHFGAPLKPVALQAGDQVVVGECVLSARGLEGSAIYAVSAALREGAKLIIDLAPGLTESTLAQRLSRPRGKASLSNHLRKAARLDPAKIALLREWTGPLPEDPAALAARIKALPAQLTGPRPMDEAISTAGGVAWDSLDGGLMLTARPGVFCAGEMLDWEAPTGGYLITGCLATGLWAGRHAADWATAR